MHVYVVSIYQDTVKMNQLQNLLHDALIATNHVSNCALVRRKDAQLRASSVGFNVGELFFFTCLYLLFPNGKHRVLSKTHLFNTFTCQKNNPIKISIFLPVSPFDKK